MPGAKIPELPAGLTLPDAGMLAMVELGGCRRMVSSSGELIGSLDQPTVVALAALADTSFG